jgi:hypothetical protein
MKVTVIPAQVTTVEDRVAGNLGLSQILLLTMPIFIGSVLYVVMPPFYHSALYKFLAIAALFIVCGLLAIRVKGKILLLWAVVLARYNLRPHYYVYDKRSLHGRELYKGMPLTEPDEEAAALAKRARNMLPLSLGDLNALHNLIENPAANITFETNKQGGLYVRITEVKAES